MLLGGWLLWVEPFLKSIAAPIGLSIELYFDSKTGFRSVLKLLVYPSCIDLQKPSEMKTMVSLCTTTQKPRKAYMPHCE